MSILDGKLRIATARDLKAPWGGRRDGSNFRCKFCGHKFKEGDYYRFVFTNDMPEACGNPLVCKSCDGPDVRERWAAKWKEWKKISEKFWWFLGLE